MPGNRFTGVYTPIGLDVRDDEVRAVQFRRTPTGVKVHAARHWRLGVSHASDERIPTLLGVLRTLRASRAFHGRTVVTALPREQVDLRPVRLPADIVETDTVRFAQALQLEANSSLPYPADMAQIDYLPLGDEVEDGERKMGLLLVASRREHVFRYVALLDQAGFDCQHLDTAACALVRTYATDAEPAAVVDMDADHTTVAIGKQGALLFSRTFPVGFAQMVEELAHNLDIAAGQARSLLMRHGLVQDGCSQGEESAPKEGAALSHKLLGNCHHTFQAMLREIRRSLNYWSRQRRGGHVHALFLSMTEISDGIGTTFENELGVPVSTREALEGLALIEPFGGLSNSDRRLAAPGRCSAYAAAAGLAARVWV